MPAEVTKYTDKTAIIRGALMGLRKIQSPNHNNRSKLHLLRLRPGRLASSYVQSRTRHITPTMIFTHNIQSILKRNVGVR